MPRKKKRDFRLPKAAELWEGKNIWESDGI